MNPPLGEASHRVFSDSPSGHCWSKGESEQLICVSHNRILITHLFRTCLLITHKRSEGQVRRSARAQLDNFDAWVRAGEITFNNDEDASLGLWEDLQTHNQEPCDLLLSCRWEGPWPLLQCLHSLSSSSGPPSTSSHAHCHNLAALISFQAITTQWNQRHRLFDHFLALFQAWATKIPETPSTD